MVRGFVEVHHHYQILFIIDNYHSIDNRWMDKCTEDEWTTATAMSWIRRGGSGIAANAPYEDRRWLDQMKAMLDFMAIFSE